MSTGIAKSVEWGRITALSIGLSIALAAPALAKIFSSVGVAQAGIIFLFFLVVVAGQVAVLISVASLFLSKFWLLVLATSLSTLNALVSTLFLSHTFIGLSSMVQGCVLFVIFILCLAILTLFSNKKIGRTSIVTFIILMIAVPFVARSPVVIDRSPAESELLSEYRSVRFDRKPDIHLISFDALIAPSLARKYLQLEEVPYEGVMNSSRFVPFPNAFASVVPTKPSLNSVMRLGNPAFGVARYEYFSGTAESPVTAILKANGYTLYNGYGNSGLGYHGPYLDDYHPQRTWRVAVNHFCDWTILNSKYLFWGFCEFFRNFGIAGLPNDWKDKFVLERFPLILHGAASPIFTFHYLGGFPGHTGGDFQYHDRAQLQQYAAAYQAGSRELADYLETIISATDSRSRDRVIFVFGDHGTFISRNATPPNIEFTVRDEHGILLRVDPGDSGCTEEDLRVYSSESFSTVERTLNALFRCLSVSQEKLDRLASFHEKHDFSQYTYE